MNGKEIKRLLEIKRYDELTEEEIRVIEEFFSQRDGYSDYLFASIEYDKMLAKMKKSVPALDDPEELTRDIMDSIQEKSSVSNLNSLTDRILDAIAVPQIQYALKALLVLIFCFYFYEELTFTYNLSNLENKYYSETVAAAGIESIINNEVSIINKIENLYELVIDEKDYLDLSDEWVLMQRTEQKRIISYYINYVLGDKYEKQELLKLVDRLDNINFLDGLNEDEIKELDKHRELIQNEINKISPGGESHE
jgi:hypothetical protein